MRRRAPAAAGAVALLLTACTGSPEFTEELLAEQLAELVAASERDSLHHVGVTKWERSDPSMQVRVLGPDGAQLWGTGNDGPISTDFPDLLAGRGFTTDRVPLARMVAVSEEYAECTATLELGYQVTPAGVDLLDAECEGGGVERRSWLGEDELPRLEQTLSAETFDTKLAEVTQVLPDRELLWWSYRPGDGPDSVVTFQGAMGDMGRGQDCALNFDRHIGPDSSALELGTCPTGLGGMTAWSINGLTGHRIHAAAIKGADEIGVGLDQLSSISMRVQANGTLTLEVMGDGRRAEVPVR